MKKQAEIYCHESLSQANRMSQLTKSLIKTKFLSYLKMQRDSLQK
jgi:hypothetical protein